MLNTKINSIINTDFIRYQNRKIIYLEERMKGIHDS